MSFHIELLGEILKNERTEISFPDLQINAQELLELNCYQALNKIKSVIEDEDMTDFECVEAIVCILEDMGSDGGFRHDF